MIPRISDVVKWGSISCWNHIHLRTAGGISTRNLGEIILRNMLYVPFCHNNAPVGDSSSVGYHKSTGENYEC